MVLNAQKRERETEAKGKTRINIDNLDVRIHFGLYSRQIDGAQCIGCKIICRERQFNSSISLLVLCACGTTMKFHEICYSEMHTIWHQKFEAQCTFKRK